MSRSSTDRFYRELREDYGIKIRQLVPRYDDLVETVVELVVAAGPGTVLDVGGGTGILAARLLERLPGARVTVMDPSAAMLEEARGRLGAWAERASFAHADVRDYTPEEPFDAILSNLVLHNVPASDKPRMLATIRDSLVPGGPFVWGDFIRHESAELQAHFVDRRMAFARKSGCPEPLVRENFRKESRDDHPLTPGDTLSLLRTAAFEDAQVAWLHDTFTVVWSRRGR